MNADPWMFSVSGKRVSLLDPQPEMFLLEDIAYALASVPRFSGHSEPRYSVAAHAVACTLHMYVRGERRPALLRAALHHDDSEAYLCDVSSPLKAAMRTMMGGAPSPYDRIEASFQAAIHAMLSTFGPIAPFDDEAVKDEDRQMLFAELATIARSCPATLGTSDPDAKHIVRWLGGLISSRSAPLHDATTFLLCERALAALQPRALEDLLPWSLRGLR